MTEKIVTLDVREDIRAGREPFTRIMQTVGELRAGEALLLIAPFEPIPLYRMLAREGFSNRARQTATGDWEVLFSRSEAAALAPAAAAAEASCSCAGQGPAIVEVDARGLEPPQPMVTILEALATLPPGAELQARTDRRPMHLYAQLEQRGFIGETIPQADGSFVTRVHRL